MPKRSPVPVLAMLVLSQLLTIALFLAAMALFRFNPANFFFAFVVPCGTLVFGMLGALGAFPGARMAQFPPGASLRNLMAGSAVLGFVLYTLVVAALANWASPDQPGVLAIWLRLETQGEFALTRGSREVANFGQVGAWGYMLLGLKFAGAGLGALAAHASLRLLPYCARCSVFTRTREKGTLHFPSFEAWAGEMQQLPAEPWARARQLLRLPRQKALSIPGRNYVLVRLRRHECPECLEQHMRERVFVHNGKAPIEAKQLSSAYSWLPEDAKTQPRPAEYQLAARGFGRKLA